MMTTEPPASDSEVDAGQSSLRAVLDALADGIARDPRNADMYADILDTLSGFAADGAGRGDLKLISHTLMDLRCAFRVFAPYRDLPKVSISGSARLGIEDPSYQQAVAFARKITDLGFMVITGAGGGIMEAGQGGAGSEKSFGVNIRLPFEQMANPVIARDPKLVNVKYFFTRKLMFLKEASAIVCFPGGVGTQDEAFEALTLAQTGKSYPVPIVLVDHPQRNYWRAWRRFVHRHVLGSGLISEEDLALFTITTDVDRACEVITRFYSVYHSLRYVGDWLVLRLNQPISDSLLAELNREFGDILIRGAISRTAPLPAERNEPKLADLPRLRLHFNRRRLGRLRQLIDRLNAGA